MQIKVTKLPNGKYYGELFVDSEIISKTVENRVGCAARNLINDLQLKYGKPTEETIVFDIVDW